MYMYSTANYIVHQHVHVDVDRDKITMHNTCTKDIGMQIYTCTSYMLHYIHTIKKSI